MIHSSAKLQWSVVFEEWYQKQVLSDLLTPDNKTEIRAVMNTWRRKSFYAYLKGVNLQQAKDGLVTPAFTKCLIFEWALWFHLHNTMLTKSHNVFSEQETYIHQHISKPYKWTMVEYFERVHTTPSNISFFLWWNQKSTRKPIGQL